MFIALHDLRFAKGRFALMAVVIVLVSFLVGFLATLTGGLARASTSAVTELSVDQLAFATPAGTKPDFTSSTVTMRQVAQWGHVPGVTSAQPLGVTTTRATAGTSASAVTAFGVLPGSNLLPPGAPTLAQGHVILSPSARDALGAGTVVTVGGQHLVVSGVSSEDASFAHTPVLWMTLADWQSTGGSASGPLTATVVAVSGSPTHGVPGMTSVTPAAARSAIASFSSENGSLRTITGFLVVISALVISAFFSVWTVNRSQDIAVLKALGASTRYLLKDAVGQAAIVLVAGVAVGTSLAWATATVLRSALPVVTASSTFAGPAGLLVVAGLLGAALAVGRITRIDPHAALAAR